MSSRKQARFKIRRCGRKVRSITAKGSIARRVTNSQCSTVTVFDYNSQLQKEFLDVG